MGDLQVIGLVIVAGMMCAAVVVGLLVCNAEDWWHDGQDPADPHPWMSRTPDKVVASEICRQLRLVADKPDLGGRDRDWLRAAAKFIEHADGR